MTNIHRHIRVHPSGALFLFVIQFHYDCEVIVFDDFSIHMIEPCGTIGSNIAEEGQEITNEIYHDLISMLHADGIC